MTQLCKYEDFLSRVEELGFMAFSKMLEGFPSLAEETPGRIWHTGDPETDPWCWKDRAAKEKKMAFGCILGGCKGFVVPRLYPLFCSACRPQQSMEERRYDGLVSQSTWELWKLFEQRGAMDTGEIRRSMGVTKKKGSGRVDSAISELQQQYYITVAGSRQRTDKFGQPYGWHINIYEKVEDWAPKEWLHDSSGLDRVETMETILDIGVKNGVNVDRIRLGKMLGFEDYR